MPISGMLFIILAVLTIGGVGKTETEKLMKNRGRALYLLFCAAVLSFFEVELKEGITVCPSCLLIPAAVFGAVCGRPVKRPAVYALLPLSIALGALLGGILPLDEEWAAALLGAISVLPTLLFGIGEGLLTSGLIPVAAQAAFFVKSVELVGYGELALTGSALSAQLYGAVFCLLSAEVNGVIRRTMVRTRSADSTINV